MEWKKLNENNEIMVQKINKNRRYDKEEKKQKRLKDKIDYKENEGNA